MIHFEVEITSVEFDAEEFTRAVTVRLGEQIKQAASKFLTAALRAIPTFNPPSGGRKSQRSTGFVAGAFTNLRQAIGKLRTGGPTGLLPTGEKAPIGLIPILKDVSGKPLKFHEAQVVGPGIFAQHLEERKRDKPQERGVESHERELTRNIRRKGKNITVRIRNEFYYGGGSKVLKTPRSGAQYATPAEKVFKGSGKTATFQYSVNIDYFSIQDVDIGRSIFAPWQAFKKGNEAFSEYILNSKRLRDIFPELSEFFVTKTYKVNTDGGISINKVQPVTVTRQGEFEGRKFF